MNSFKYISFNNQINIYWLYEDYDSKASYDIYLNDVFIGSTNKNHFEIKDLVENTKYKIEVFKNEESLHLENILTDNKEEIIVNVDNSGTTLVTKELQKILDNASNKLIVFPKGIYLTGALFIKPNTHIKLEKDALIQGSVDFKDYLPKIKSRFEGLEMECYASLINIGEIDPYSESKDMNIAIYGDGSIFGGGSLLADAIKEEEIKYIDISKLDLNKIKPLVEAGRRRGRLIQINNSNNVVIDGLNLGKSASWNLHFIYSKNIVVSNCYIESHGVHNGDGIDPDSSENVAIYGVKFSTSDDCIAIKSGKNPTGNIINRPTKYVDIFDCVSDQGHGCSIGSEISGGISDVKVFNCDFIATRHGLQIKTTLKRGGYVKNLIVEDSKFPAINARQVGYNDDGESSNTISIFENFKFINCELTGILTEENETLLKKFPCKYVEINGFENYPANFSNFIFINTKYIEGGLDNEIKNASCINFK